MYVPARSILTYQFKAQTSLSNTSGTAIEQAVAADLNGAGFTVTDFSINDSLLGIIEAAGIGYTVQITLKVKTGATEYADETDVQSIFDHYVYQETGNFPASVITQVQLPTATTPTTTGQTQQPPSGGNGGGNPAPSFWDTLTTFVEGLGSGAILAIGLAIVGIVLVVGWAESRKLI